LIVSSNTELSILGASNWDSVVKPPELQDGWGKEADNKSTSNNSGWGGKTNESPVKVSGGGGWGAGSPVKESTPPKPCLVVNKPPVEAAIDTKNDPRMKPKRRISMADYKKRKEEETVSVSPEKETQKEDKDDAVVDGIAVESTKELEAELLGETNETNGEKEDQVQSGGSSPTSPAFEVETAPAPQPVDPKEVLTELAEELGNDSDAKFSSDEEEL